jgi:hypothetical protein
MADSLNVSSTAAVAAVLKLYGPEEIFTVLAEAANLAEGVRPEWRLDNIADSCHELSSLAGEAHEGGQGIIDAAIELAERIEIAQKSAS